ncbi:MAG: MaoC family dehydratase N-terminal domain-containing protein [Dehalococcoidales bacterium]
MAAAEGEALSLAQLVDKSGYEFKPVVCEIEKGMIRRFVEAVGDDNPRWQEEAPPTLALTLGFDRIQEVLSSDPALTVLHGSTELESYQPLRPGDVITVSARIAKVRQRQGKMGLSRFVTFEISCRNQRNEPVASCRQMAIVY